jgi:transmembrane sensor
MPRMAGGLPINEKVADQAAEWLTLLMSNEISDADKRRWRQWRGAHPDHERAWQHIETVTQRLKMAESSTFYKVLSPYAGPKSSGRRKLLNILLWGSVSGTAAVLTTRTQTWQQQVADYQTRTGEQRSFTLNDGSQITLNTGSAINVRFDGERRLVSLVAGEILITTAQALNRSQDSRPFVVETAEGRVRALGTRFSVRQNDKQTVVAVQESAVEITTASGEVSRTLTAGQLTYFSRTEIETSRELTPADDAWTRGQIVATDMPLEEFTRELSRYRSGIVRCSPEVASLRVSGVFPLQDTNRILGSLPNVLPVQISLRTRFWVTIEPA